MSFILIWSEFAEDQLDEIFDYYNLEVNEKGTLKIIRELIAAADILVD
jgi:plasmid stabilization system protein ParE